MDGKLVALDAAVNLLWPVLKPHAKKGYKKLRTVMSDDAKRHYEQKAREAVERFITSEWKRFVKKYGDIDRRRMSDAIHLSLSWMPDNVDDIVEPNLRRAARAINWLDSETAYQRFRGEYLVDPQRATIEFLNSKPVKDYVDARFLEDRRFTDDSCPGYIGNRFASNHDGG